MSNTIADIAPQAAVAAHVAGRLAEMEQTARDAAERHKAEMARRDGLEQSLRAVLKQSQDQALWLDTLATALILDKRRAKLRFRAALGVIVALLVALAWSNWWRWTL